MAVSAGVGGAALAGGTKTNYYVFDQYFLKNGSQQARINEFMSKGLIPALARIAPGPVIAMESLVAAHMPQYVSITGLGSLEALARNSARLGEDDGYRRAREEWESGAEPPYEHFSRTILEAMPYSPEIAPLAARPAKPRIFELRIYHSPTQRQLRALHERFAGPEIRIFHRCGVHPLFYSQTVCGANMPNLTYLIPFDSLAAREKAWDAFGADPEWVKVRKESVDRHGQISSVIQMSLFRVAPYSPVP
jgi:hypothetical protein